MHERVSAAVIAAIGVIDSLIIAGQDVVEQNLVREVAWISGQGRGTFRSLVDRHIADSCCGRPVIGCSNGFDIANRRRIKVNDLVTEIKQERTASGLTAAIRVYVVNFYRTAAVAPNYPRRPFAPDYPHRP